MKTMLTLAISVFLAAQTASAATFKRCDIPKEDYPLTWELDNGKIVDIYYYGSTCSAYGKKTSLGDYERIRRVLRHWLPVLTQKFGALI